MFLNALEHKNLDNVIFGFGQCRVILPLDNPLSVYIFPALFKLIYYQYKQVPMSIFNLKRYNLDVTFLR